MLRVRPEESQAPLIGEQTVPPVAVVAAQTRRRFDHHRSYGDHCLAIGRHTEIVSRHNGRLVGSVHDDFEALRRTAAQMIGVVVVMLQQRDQRAAQTGRMCPKRIGEIEAGRRGDVVVTVLRAPVRLGAAIVPDRCEIAGQLAAGEMWKRLFAHTYMVWNGTKKSYLLISIQFRGVQDVVCKAEAILCPHFREILIVHLQLVFDLTNKHNIVQFWC